MADREDTLLANRADKLERLRANGIDPYPASEDGGYYAVGCRSAKAGMFKEVSWSTASTLTETERAFKRAGLTSERLPAWYDIDTIENLRRLVSESDLPEHGRRWLHQNPDLW